MDKTAELIVEGKSHRLSVVEGTEQERGIDISSLRNATGLITLDDGYANTGSCQSQVTFIDGEKGILRYRGIPIEELAEKSTFIEVTHLIVMGRLPTSAELRRFSDLLTDNELLNEAMKHHFEGFPAHAHPMAILSSMINAASCFYPELLTDERHEHFMVSAARLLSQVRTIAAFAYRKSRGLPIIYPKPELKYTANFLHMMFSVPYRDYEIKPEAAKALDLIFLLHADHEQNCSDGDDGADGRFEPGESVCQRGGRGLRPMGPAAWRSANQAVLEMLQDIHDSGDDGSKFIAAAKDKNSGKRLMGFGHRVYKNYDPRAKIIKKACDDVLSKLHISDPLLDIAQHLEEAALKDPYFVERKLYPNVDFYSGIIMRAIGIPLEMFTVIFAIGRMPGWIANYKEVMEAPTRIYRPRQIYVGPTLNHYIPIKDRK